MLINELKTVKSDTNSLKKIAALVKRDCQPYLRAVNNDPQEYMLWRGATSDHRYSKIACPKNRPPVNILARYHRTMDNWFLKHTGIRFRSNALFVTHDMSNAAIYGPVNAVFPIGEFKFCWSPNIEDPYGDLVPEDDWMPEDRISQKDLEAELARSYSTKDFTKAIKSGHEIMVHAPAGFYLLLHDYDNEQELQTIVNLVSGKNGNELVSDTVKPDIDRDIKQAKANITTCLNVIHQQEGKLNGSEDETARNLIKFYKEKVVYWETELKKLLQKQIDAIGNSKNDKTNV